NIDRGGYCTGDPLICHNFKIGVDCVRTKLIDEKSVTGSSDAIPSHRSTARPLPIRGEKQSGPGTEIAVCLTINLQPDLTICGSQVGGSTGQAVVYHRWVIGQLHYKGITGNSVGHRFCGSSIAILTCDVIYRKSNRQSNLYSGIDNGSCIG